MSKFISLRLEKTDQGGLSAFISSKLKNSTGTDQDVVIDAAGIKHVDNGAEQAFAVKTMRSLNALVAEMEREYERLLEPFKKVIAMVSSIHKKHLEPINKELGRIKLLVGSFQEMERERVLEASKNGIDAEIVRAPGMVVTERVEYEILNAEVFRSLYPACFKLVPVDAEIKRLIKAGQLRDEPFITIKDKVNVTTRDS